MFKSMQHLAEWLRHHNIPAADVHIRVEPRTTKAHARLTDAIRKDYIAKHPLGAAPDDLDEFQLFGVRGRIDPFWIRSPK